MEIVIIFLLIILFILNIYLIIKISKNKSSNTDIITSLGKLETSVTKDIGDFKYDFGKSLTNDIEKLNKTITENLIRINDRVNERIDVNFEKTNKTFNNILERLSKIDEAQKKIDNLSTDIVSLQSILTDKKTRGIFGEVNLNYILVNVFGENNKKIYDIQHKMSNGYIADAIIYAPQPLGTIAVDSKFPLENYQKMTDKNLSNSEREMYTRLFKNDVKKHIDAISNKYIIDGETSNQAIMFLPAEAIFAEINAYHNDLLNYAYQKKVWITSPTTLMSTLSVISMILKNIERDKYAKVIHNELNKLSIEFDKYKLRWDKLSRSIDTVTKDVKDINITTDKISKRFQAINGVNLEEIDSGDNDEKYYNV